MISGTEQKNMDSNLLLTAEEITDRLDITYDQLRRLQNHFDLKPKDKIKHGTNRYRLGDVIAALQVKVENRRKYTISEKPDQSEWENLLNDPDRFEKQLRANLERLKSYSAVGRKYGVSATTVRKYCRDLGITEPETSNRHNPLKNKEN